MPKKEKKRRWPWIVGILLFIVLLFFGCVSLLVEDLDFGNVASIPIRGVILMDGTKTTFGDEIASATEITKFIKKAEENELIEAIILDINSPGGSAVASMEIADAVKRANKPVIAVIREVGASGAYWVASAADVIFARELSITGSIGVMGSYVEYAGLLERFNMTYRRLVAGESKDIGTPYRELQPHEQAKLQKLIDRMHGYFIAHIAENRGLTIEHVQSLADGFVFLGDEAVDNRLIDRIGSYDDAIKHIEYDLNITADIVEYKHKPTFLEALSTVFWDQSYSVGRGIGDSFKTVRHNTIEVFT